MEHTVLQNVCQFGPMLALLLSEGQGRFREYPSGLHLGTGCVVSALQKERQHGIAAQTQVTQHNIVHSWLKNAGLAT